MSHIDEGELTAYADGAYAPDDPVAQRIAGHVAECANCRNRLAAAAALSAQAGEVLAFAAPVAVAAPAFEQIRQAARNRPRRSALIPAAWAASIVLALGLGWFARTAVLPEPERLARAPAAAPPSMVPAPTVPESTIVAAAPETRVAETQPRAAKTRAEPPQNAAGDLAAGAAASSAVAPAEVGQAAPVPAAPVAELHVIPGLAMVERRVAGDSVVI
ncbi:MAG TPA: hypothetical protein VF021_06535, partial [Longimicrobiales bacterium]